MTNYIISTNPFRCQKFRLDRWCKHWSLWIGVKGT